MPKLTPKQKSEKKFWKKVKMLQKKAHEEKLDVENDPEVVEMLKKLRKRKRKSKKYDWRELF